MPAFAEISVSTPRQSFQDMLRLVGALHRLQACELYEESLRHRIPEIAHADPHNDSVLMGYDFHLSPDGPKLIEINNNAAGLYAEGAWLPQPLIAELPGELTERLDRMFDPAWQQLAIVDEHVSEQFMYPEMLAYADLFQQRGRQAVVVSPEDIDLGEDGDLYVEGRRLDVIYNRHTDFYLEHADLAHIRTAYLAGTVALTPNPRSYGLLGDKRRMVDWWRPGLLESFDLAAEDIALIRRISPEIHLLADMDSEWLWDERKAWVFKPAARHGGKGVLLGKAMSRKRFEALDGVHTVVQRFVPPGRMSIDGVKFKTDIRLYTHADRLVAVAARIYQGQVTNFRTPGSGFVPLAITE
ncbi:MAG: hypothetical protein R8K46_01605 [Mariprofundaceae bacterium]